MRERYVGGYISSMFWFRRPFSDGRLSFRGPWATELSGHGAAISEGGA